jgi:hypothetical protein
VQLEVADERLGQYHGARRLRAGGIKPGDERILERVGRELVLKRVRAESLLEGITLQLVAQDLRRAARQHRIGIDQRQFGQRGLEHRLVGVDD